MQETNTGFYFLEDGILHIKVKANAEFTLENVQADRKEYKKLLGDKKVPVFIDSTEVFAASKQGMEYSSSPEANQNRLAIAYLVKNPAVNFIVNIYRDEFKPNLPIKVFTDKETALSWLETFKE